MIYKQVIGVFFQIIQFIEREIKKKLTLYCIKINYTLN